MEVTDITMRVPNSETMEALEEVKTMQKDASLGKMYTDVDDMMKDYRQIKK